MFKKFIATLGCSAALLFAAEFQVGTYFPNWLQYSQFTPDDVRYEFLTHIHYGYFIPSEDGSSITNSDENDNPNFEKLASLSKEKKVSLTVNVGGVGNEEAMKAVEELIGRGHKDIAALISASDAGLRAEAMRILLQSADDSNFRVALDDSDAATRNRVLQEFSKMIDTEAHGMGEWYRMDGTKFAIVCKKSSVDDLKNLYKRIQYNSIHDFMVDGNRVVLSFVAGAINLDSLDVSSETVYSCLRFAYYESKNNHLGELFVLKNNVSDDKRFAIERINVIRNSIVNNCEGFYLCYQPIVDANTEKVIGAESLIRWKNEEYGVVPPVEFVDVLEQDNLFPELGKWILKSSIRDAKKFLDSCPGFVINVNLSYTQLEKPDFVESVLAILEEEKYPPQNLCLEITERCRLLDMALLKDIFTRLRNRGIKVALDDFGTGYSSIGVLRELPVTTVKIDRSFVMNIEQDPSDQKTVRFISELADSFSSSVTAEGIETPEMREFLLRFKIKSLQGFYYSKPLPVDEFMDKYVNV